MNNYFKITNLTAKQNKIKSYYNLKISSNSLSYDDLNMFNTAISATLLNIQPMPFCFIGFVINKNYNMTVSDESVYFTYEITVKKIIVKIKDNLPIYVFDIDINTSNVNFLSDNMISPVEFDFEEK